MQNREELDPKSNNHKFAEVAYNIIKRVMDIIGSAMGLVVLSPLLLLIGICVKIESKGPMIFAHMRLGQGGKLLTVYKFRSMVSDAEIMLENLSEEQKLEFDKNFKLEKDPRVTKLGSFLRKSSLDELPQLLNVFLGHMTVVGPRPIVPAELIKYGKYADKLLSVKPGLTGSWQTSGRSDTTYDERVQLDMEYIDNRNIWIDLKIFFKTFIVVFKQIGAK